MTDLRLSQVVRQTVANNNPALRYTQIARQVAVFPNIPLRLSQIVRMTIVVLPVPTTLYCWARQTNFPYVTAVTPVLVSPPS